MIQHLFDGQALRWYVGGKQTHLKEWPELRQGTFDTIRDLVAYCVTTREQLRVVMRNFKILTVDGTFLFCRLELVFVMFLTRDAYGRLIPVMAAILRSENVPGMSFSTLRVLPFFLGRICEQLRLLLSDKSIAFVETFAEGVSIGLLGDTRCKPFHGLCFWHALWKRLLEATAKWGDGMSTKYGTPAVAILAYARDFARNLADVEKAFKAARKIISDAIDHGISRIEAAHFQEHVIDYARGNARYLFPRKCNTGLFVDIPYPGNMGIP